MDHQRGTGTLRAGKRVGGLTAARERDPHVGRFTDKPGRFFGRQTQGKPTVKRDRAGLHSPFKRNAHPIPLAFGHAGHTSTLTNTPSEAPTGNLGFDVGITGGDLPRGRTRLRELQRADAVVPGTGRKCQERRAGRLPSKLALRPEGQRYSNEPVGYLRWES